MSEREIHPCAGGSVLRLITLGWRQLRDCLPHPLDPLPCSETLKPWFDEVLCVSLLAISIIFAPQLDQNGQSNLDRSTPPSVDPGPLNLGTSEFCVEPFTKLGPILCRSRSCAAVLGLQVPTHTNRINTARRRLKANVTHNIWQFAVTQ